MGSSQLKCCWAAGPSVGGKAKSRNGKPLVHQFGGLCREREIQNDFEHNVDGHSDIGPRDGNWITTEKGAKSSPGGRNPPSERQAHGRALTWNLQQIINTLAIRRIGRRLG